MDNIPTAEDKAYELQHFLSYNELQNPVTFAAIVAIEFAKLHVEAALKEASEKAKAGKEGAFGVYWNRLDIIIDKDSILKSYPFENIK